MEHYSNRKAATAAQLVVARPMGGTTLSAGGQYRMAEGVNENTVDVPKVMYDADFSAEGLAGVGPQIAAALTVPGNCNACMPS